MFFGVLRNDCVVDHRFNLFKNGETFSLVEILEGDNSFLLKRYKFAQMIYSEVKENKLNFLFLGFEFTKETKRKVQRKLLLLFYPKQNVVRSNSKMILVPNGEGPTRII